MSRKLAQLCFSRKSLLLKYLQKAELVLLIQSDLVHSTIRVLRWHFLNSTYLNMQFWIQLIFISLFLFPGGSDLQTEPSDQVETLPWDGDCSLGPAQEWKGGESWRVVVVAGPAETRLECVVSWWTEAKQCNDEGEDEFPLGRKKKKKCFKAKPKNRFYDDEVNVF